MQKKLFEKLVVKSGQKIKLEKIDAADSLSFKSKEDVAVQKQKNLEILSSVQYKLFAENKRSVLIVLQGMDAAGKDGTIRHVMSALNAQSCRVVPFKTPSTEDLSHDFLWRIHKETPGRGQIVIFNRSHYEDVLIARVHKLVEKKVWSKRFAQINDFERLLSENGVTILKFFLHISHDEQRSRLLKRLNDPAKQWKITEADIRETALWDDYQVAYEDAFCECSTPYGRWFIIPADKKWFRDYAVSAIIAQEMGKLDIKIPKPVIDLNSPEVVQFRGDGGG